MKLINVLLGIMILAPTNGDEDLTDVDKRKTGDEDLTDVDKRKTGDEDLIAMDKRQYKYNTCVVTQSDGVGGTEVELYGNAKESPSSCFRWCRRYQKRYPRWKYRDINGMTFSRSNNCYCEKNMTGQEESDDYRSCFFKDIDDCISKPCKNGGTCVNDMVHYTCVCNSGYTGKNCEVYLNKYLITATIGSDWLDATNGDQFVQIKGTEGETAEFQCEGNFKERGKKVICTVYSAQHIGDFECVIWRSDSQNDLRLTQVDMDINGVPQLKYTAAITIDESEKKKLCRENSLSGS